MAAGRRAAEERRLVVLRGLLAEQVPIEGDTRRGWLRVALDEGCTLLRPGSHEPARLVDVCGGGFRVHAPRVAALHGPLDVRIEQASSDTLCFPCEVAWASGVQQGLTIVGAPRRSGDQVAP